MDPAARVQAQEKWGKVGMAQRLFLCRSVLPRLRRAGRYRQRRHRAASPAGSSASHPSGSTRGVGETEESKSSIERLLSNVTMIWSAVPSDLQGTYASREDQRSPPTTKGPQLEAAIPALGGGRKPIGSPLPTPSLICSYQERDHLAEPRNIGPWVTSYFYIYFYEEERHQHLIKRS